MGSNFVENDTSDLDNVFQSYRGIQPYTDVSYSVNCGRPVNFDVGNTSTDLRYRYEPIYTSSMLSAMTRSFPGASVSISVSQTAAGSTGFIVNGVGDLSGIFAKATTEYKASVTISGNQLSGMTLSSFLTSTCHLNFSFFTDVDVTVLSGVTIANTLQTGSGIPSLYLTNNGAIYGGGGDGGGGDTPAFQTNNQVGGDGGDGITCGQNCTIVNNGSIKGGGGGGGGGGFNGTDADMTSGGGGGGGGEGYPGGGGGSGGRATADGQQDGQDGTSGTTSSAGVGGYGGGKGGNGGTYGNAGGAGANGTPSGYSDGARGGAGGYSVNYNSYSVTFANNGTLSGSYGTKS